MSGASISPLAPSGEGIAYLAQLESRLVQAGFENLGQPVGLDADRVYRRQRFQFAMLSKVANLCAVRGSRAPLTVEAVRSYSLAVFSFADGQKGLLEHGPLQPLVVYPVIVAADCPPEVEAFLDTHWPKRFQAYEFPVVVALASRRIFFHRTTPLWGMAAHMGFAREAEELFAP